MLYDSRTCSVKLVDLYSNTRYLICVTGLSNSYSPSTTDKSNDKHSDGHFSRCTEVRTLDIGEDYRIRSPHENSILTRRLGLIIGSCMGCIVFVILVVILVLMKIKKQRKNAKNDQPLPPEYLSYRHFSLQGCDSLSVHAQRTSTLNL